MFTEQPDLFGESQAAQKQPEKAASNYQEIPGAFIPGVDLSAAFPEIIVHEELRQMTLQCSSCRLRSTCQQVVFADGNPASRIMFVGEGPGRDEDLQGRPFVGRAGQLLDKILAASSLAREEVYITNVVKCRPPENRLPNPDEVKVCRNFLEAQIRIIKPSIIVCLGSLASQVVIDPKARITQIRGKWFQRQGIKITAAFHPAALLRNEAYKRPTWDDFKKIRDEYQHL